MATVPQTAAARKRNSYIRNNGEVDIPEAAVTEIHLGDDEFKCLLLLQVLISHRAKSKFTVISPTKEDCIIKESGWKSHFHLKSSEEY